MVSEWFDDTYLAMMQQLETFANDMIHTFGVEGQIWIQGADYKPGDVVYVDLPAVMTGTQYQCRQAPFGDFCGDYDPTSQQGIQAWRLYTEGMDELPEPNHTLVKCVNLDADVHFWDGDKACYDDHVWQCKDGAADWCDLHPVGSAYSYLAWRVIEGAPDPVDTITEMREAPEANRQSEAATVIEQKLSPCQQI